MGSLDPRYLSIWKIINATSKSTTTDHPDVIELLAHCAATVGTPEFGIPRLPDGRQPNILPRDAVNRLWAKARQHLAKTKGALGPGRRGKYDQPQPCHRPLRACRHHDRNSRVYCVS